jgi:prevent-host-death family protein
MTRRISIEAARDQFDDLVREVAQHDDTVVVERDGSALVAVISARALERFRQLAKDRFFEVVDRIHRANADADPDEVMREVTAAVEEVRQAAYERRLRDSGSA